jgi:hypothetical protein
MAWRARLYIRAIDKLIQLPTSGELAIEIPISGTLYRVESR